LHQLGIEENKYKYYFNPTKATYISKLLSYWKKKIQKYKN
jgi:hypothetical protein